MDTITATDLDRLEARVRAAHATAQQTLTVLHLEMLTPPHDMPDAHLSIVLDSIANIHGTLTPWMRSVVAEAARRVYPQTDRP